MVAAAAVTTVGLTSLGAHPASGTHPSVAPVAVTAAARATSPIGQAHVGITMRLVEQDAVVPPDGEFTVFLEVEGAPTGSDIAIDIYPMIDDQDELDDALAGDLRNSQATFPVVDLPPDPGGGPLMTGFSISIYPRGQPSPGGGWAKRLTEAGVYPVRVRLRGPDSQTLSTLVTFLVRSPEDGDEGGRRPTPVALLADVSDVVDADTSSLDLDDTPLGDEALGRLRALLDTFADHPDLPVSFVVPGVVTRRLAASASEPLSSDDGSDHGPEGNTSTGGGTSPGDPTLEGPTGSDGAAGPGDASAPGGAQGSGRSPEVPTSDGSGAGGGGADVLERFRATLAGEERELLASPFVDVDPTELVAGRLTDELALQHRLGFRDLAEVLEPPVEDTWTVARPLDPKTVDALAAAGITNLLLPPSSIDGAAPTIPFRAVGTTGGSRAMVVDPAVSTGRGDDPVLAAHRLLAQTVARAEIGDRAPQVITVKPPESVEDVAELDAVLTLLATHAASSALEPTRVSDLISSSATAADRSTLTRPPGLKLGTYPDDLVSTRRLVDAYSSSTTEHPELAGRLGEQLSRSATAGLAPHVRHQVVEGVREGVEARFAQVTIPESDRVTLGARDAQFPLVVSSRSDVPLKVLVELSSTSDRLTVKDESIEVVLDSERTVVPVRVHSRSPGDTPIRIAVTTLDGQVILSEGTYSVRSTAVSGVGLLLTIGAGLFLAVWWGRHLVGSRRAAGRHAR